LIPLCKKKLLLIRDLVGKGRSDTVKITAPVTLPCPDSYHEIQIPAGTKIYVGEVGYQTNLYSGGTEQVLIPAPWKIPSVKILSSGGLK